MNDTSTKIDEQAREWFVLMQSGSVSAAERQRLAEWLSADPAQRAAYTQYERIWQDLGDLAHSSEGAALKRSVSGIPPETGPLAWVSQAAEALSNWGKHLVNPWSGLAYATVVIAAGVVFFSAGVPERRVLDHYQTQVAEVKALTLEDGSEIVLGAKSEIRVRFDTRERYIELVQGQAFFDVATNAERPFVVETNDTLVTVVGTRFDVRRGEDQVSVAVEEGTVSVSALLREGQMAGDIDRPEPVVLSAGQKVSRVSRSRFQPIESVAVANVGAWRQGRLVYRGAPLKEVVEDANRYFSGTISLESTEIAEIEVTASFRADQVGDLPDLLTGFLPVAIVRTEDHIAILPQSAHD